MNFQLKDPPDKENFSQILAILEKYVDPNLYKQSYLTRRINFSLRKQKCKTYREYAEKLRHDHNALAKLVQSLSINVTSFYRDEEPYFELAAVLPTLVQENEERYKLKGLRIWSAGTATGAEAYTLAIILHQLGDDIFERSTIYATDINEEFLSIGRRGGPYRKDQLKVVPPHIINAYFVATRKNNNEELYYVKPFLQRPIKFIQHNLADPPPVKIVDVVLCRNVLIYFNQQSSLKIIRQFWQVLRSGGLLVLGKTELLPREFSDRFERLVPKQRIYRKR